MITVTVHPTEYFKQKGIMNYNYKLYNTKGKYDLIMDVARTLSMDEIQVLEKMLLDLWCDKLKKLSEENDAAQQSNIQR